MLQSLNININLVLSYGCIYLIISLLNTNVAYITKILHEIWPDLYMYIMKKGKYPYGNWCFDQYRDICPCYRNVYLQMVLKMFANVFQLYLIKIIFG